TRMRVGEMAHADDHDLAQPAGKRRLPSHRIGVIEPALRERGSVEQHAIDVDQLPAPAGTEFFDHIRKFRDGLALGSGERGPWGSFSFTTGRGADRVHGANVLRSVIATPS